MKMMLKTRREEIAKKGATETTIAEME